MAAKKRHSPAFAQGRAISRITKAYEQMLHTLCVKDRDDPLAETIAKQIIKIAQAGVHDAAQLSALAIAELSIRYGRLRWRPPWCLRAAARSRCIFDQCHV
jgi:predicted ATPase